MGMIDGRIRVVRLRGELTCSPFFIVQCLVAHGNNGGTGEGGHISLKHHIFLWSCLLLTEYWVILALNL